MFTPIPAKIIPNLTCAYFSKGVGSTTNQDGFGKLLINLFGFIIGDLGCGILGG